VADQSNEITAVPELLRVLELRGCMVTVDAMGCPQKIAREMVEADADDVLALKGNQETGQAEVKPFLDATLAEKQGPAPAGSQVIARRRHAGEWGDGGEGSRTLGNPPLLSERGAGLVGRFGQMGRAALGWHGGSDPGNRRQKDGGTPLLPVEPAVGRAARGHWGVENKRHWVLDAHFREDHSRARSGYAAENQATLRRLALNLLKLEKTKKRSIKGKQLNAGWNHAYLLQLLGI